MNKDCAEIRELFSPYADGELDEAGQAAVADHIANCSACQVEWEARQRVSALLECWQVPEVPASATARFADAMAAREKRPALRWLPRLAWGAAGLCAIIALVLAQRPAERVGQYTLQLPAINTVDTKGKKAYDKLEVASAPGGPGVYRFVEERRLGNKPKTMMYDAVNTNGIVECASEDTLTHNLQEAKRVVSLPPIYPPYITFYSRGYPIVRSGDEDIHADLAETGR